eukprot:TRINITY_DN35844_c0_g1_i1.p1 TRINITY_DN35844_c0_g1~~TRINITY_DN35844_c0_g1_i1.p1  ORF type:complete len:437 (+),score=75.48 TRINITY_DN35844_c0_g1_i1:60-1370(+)
MGKGAGNCCCGPCDMHTPKYTLQVEETPAEADTAGELNLEGMRLRRFPQPALRRFQPGRLRFVNVSGNIEMPSLPHDLAKFENLESMILDHTQITAVPPVLPLLSLSQRFSELKHIPRGIQRLVNLQILDLGGEFEARDNNRISNVEGLGTLQRLQRLDLSHNRISSLPPSFFDLTSLRELNLEGNKLTSIHHAIAHLTDLSSLNLAQNRIESLPETFCSLTNLTKLNLRGHALTTLPPGFGQLQQLRSLNLEAFYHSSLATLPHELEQITTLRKLDLSWNQYLSLTPVLSRLTSLENLRLNTMHLTTLPRDVMELPNLTHLNAYINEIDEIPHEITALTTLQHLDLSHNKIRKVPGFLARLTRLVYLNLNNNVDLVDVADEVLEMQSLRVIELEGTPCAHLGRGFSEEPDPDTPKLDRARAHKRQALLAEEERSV